jgi:hypothetical protein
MCSWHGNRSMFNTTHFHKVGVRLSFWQQSYKIVALDVYNRGEYVLLPKKQVKATLKSLA